jgi:2-deoxy-D-gluconate 3-dehydrogenase
MSLKGKVALVTGGTRGIGLAMVKALKAEGCKVAITGRERHNLPVLADMYFPIDLSVRKGSMAIVPLIVQELGGIDILVNNAGAQFHGPANKYKLKDWDHSLELMITAPAMLSANAKRYMPPGSHIINILSTASFQGARNIVGYVVAKHGLLGLTRALAIEWAPDIHVNAIAPGLTETDMLADMTPERKEFLKSITPGGKFCTPEDIAEALIYLVNSKSIYGQVITVDNGWLAKQGG